jgi:hypothetical protein
MCAARGANHVLDHLLHPARPSSMTTNRSKKAKTLLNCERRIDEHAMAPWIDALEPARLPHITPVTLCERPMPFHRRLRNDAAQHPWWNPRLNSGECRFSWPVLFWSCNIFTSQNLIATNSERNKLNLCLYVYTRGLKDENLIAINSKLRK